MFLNRNGPGENITSVLVTNHCFAGLLHAPVSLISFLG